MQPGEEAGLVVIGESPAMLGIQHDGKMNLIVLNTDKKQKIIAETASNSIKLRMEILDGGRCRFAYGKGGGFIAIGQEFQARKGAWIGAKIGLYSLKHLKNTAVGHVDFDYFRFA